MATILSDKEIEGLIGTVIKNGDPSCIRSNSYILRLGKEGVFLNSKKKFSLDKDKIRGIKVQPGHSVNLSACEDIDFRREAVHQIYPGHDLHAFISPTTDLSREGLMTSTTQVDAGYHGTLNWTLTNTSYEEQSFIFEEELFRLTFFKLSENEEIPEKLYDGHYQGRYGHVPSERKGPPRGMRPDQWINSKTEGGPEEKLEEIINSGWPFNTLGKQLKVVDDQFKEIREEYDAINRSINDAKKDITKDLKREIYDILKDVFNDYAFTLRLQWLTGAAGLLVVAIGLLSPVYLNDKANLFFKNNLFIISPILTIIGVCVIIYAIKKKSSPTSKL